MTGSVYLSFALCVGLGLAGRWLHRLPPRAGSWTLVVATTASGIGTLWALTLLAGSLVDDLPGVDGEGAFGLPVDDRLSVLAGVLLGGCLIRVFRESRRQRSTRRELSPLRAIPGTDVIVLPDVRAHAFVTPGRGGRVVVTDAMLRALDPVQRRALLAHERAHVAAYHPLALALLRLAAAANPFLQPAARSAAFLIERHADEAAAVEVGDREVVAMALARVALVRSASLSPAFTGVAVADRVTALLSAPRRGSRVWLGVVACAAVVVIAASTEATFDFAGLVYRLLVR